MGTPFNEIYDMFLSQIRDYKIDKLYSVSISNFENYLQGFLLMAIPEFDNCVKNLEDYDLNNSSFNVDLTLREKTILANLMIIKWLTKEINDVTQFNLHLNDTDFKHYSEAQNLKEKVEYRDRLREIVNQDMTIYGLKTISWQDWAGGNFGI